MFSRILRSSTYLEIRDHKIKEQLKKTYEHFLLFVTSCTNMLKKLFSSKSIWVNKDELIYKFSSASQSQQLYQGSLKSPKFIGRIHSWMNRR